MIRARDTGFQGERRIEETRTLDCLVYAYERHISWWENNLLSLGIS